MSALVSIAQLADLKNLQLIEVGEKTIDPVAASEAFNAYQCGHIAHAKYVDIAKQFSDVSSGFEYTLPSLAQFKADFKTLGLSWEYPIVIYDRANHIWAARLWWILSAFGHSQTYVLHGGWQAWQQHSSKHPILVEPPVNNLSSTISNQLQLNTSMFVTLPEVIDASKGKDDVQLLNVLRQPVFEGTELRYHRAGHIPNSINIPFLDFLTDQGYFKKLDSEFSQQHFLDFSKEIIIYCGSGITASGAALALTEAGAQSVKIYDGSMEEWSANPSLPLNLITG